MKSDWILETPSTAPAQPPGDGGRAEKDTFGTKEDSKDLYVGVAWSVGRQGWEVRRPRGHEMGIGVGGGFERKNEKIMILTKERGTEKTRKS